MKLRILLSWGLVWLFGMTIWAQDCYQIIDSNTGIVALYDSFLEQKACELKATMRDLDPSVNISVLGADYYPPMAYADESDAFRVLHEQTLIKVNGDPAHESYVLITKSHPTGEGIRYRLAIKFPTVGHFANLSPVDKEAIEALVLQAIKTKATESASSNFLNPSAEAAGLELLGKYFDDIANNTLDLGEGTLELAGFKQVTIEQDIAITLEQNEVLSQSNIYDYAGIKIEGSNDYVWTGAVEIFNLITFGAPAMVFTASNMTNYASRMNAAETTFETAENLLVTWMHFDVQPEETQLYYKVKSNVTQEEAKQIIDTKFSNHLREYVLQNGEEWQGARPGGPSNGNSGNLGNSIESNGDGLYNNCQSEHCNPSGGLIG
ncbi:MAG: hypothetical protein AAGD05_06060, partial [Bacteroidota bacterium]